MKKWNRTVDQVITKAGAKVVSRKKIGGHFRLTLLLPTGVERKLVVASSPAIEEAAAVAVERDVLRLINSTTT